MPKDIEFPASAILQSSPISRPSSGTSSSVTTPPPASSNGNRSTRSPSAFSSSSAAKYRMSFARTDSSDTHPTSPWPSAAAPSSPKARSASQQISSQNAASILAMMKGKTGTHARISASNNGMLAIGIAPTDALEPSTNSATGALMSTQPSSPKAKLPDKLRQHVSRLRSQFALVTSPSPSSFTAKSGLKLAHRVSGLVGGGGGMSPSKQQLIGPTNPIASTRALLMPNTSPTAVSSSNGLKYSRQSYKIQTLQAQLSMLKMSNRNVLKNSTSPPSATSALIPAGNEEEELPAGTTSSPKEDNTVHFFDLLRPLQNSLSCASLMSEWASDDEEQQGQHDQQGDLYNGQQPQSQQPQPERHRSRMLRICCSVDNLLLSIGNQVQEEKHDEAIARGAARQLLELFQFAINQVAAIPTTSADSSDPSVHVDNNSSKTLLLEDDKELQYMQEFIVEIAERMSRLDQFVRSTFISEISGLQERSERDKLEMAELKLSNAQLHTEMNDLRDFHSQNSMSVLGFARNNSSSSSFGAPPGDLKSAGELTKEDNQERMASLFPAAAAAAATANTSSPSSECPLGVDDRLEQLRKQCDEFARLLEMAKQEIRLCHREHDVQKSRIAELSNAMFKDQELTSVCNQLQSEKRRVKNLEIENVSLRESQIDQSMKIQSLLANGALTMASQAPAQGDTKASGANDVPGHQSLERSDSSSNSAARLQWRGSVSVSIGSESPSSLAGAADSLSKPENGSGAGGPEAPRGLLRRQSSSNSTPPSSPKRKDNSSGNLSTSGDDSRANWFYRVLGLNQSQQEPVSRKRQHLHQPDSTPDDTFSQSLAQQKQFLSGLLLSKKQTAVAQAQSKIRRQGNVPTIVPPVLPASIDVQGSGSTSTAPKKTKKKPVINNSQGDGNSAEDMRDAVIVCRQLIWFFYQRFLMLEEAHALASPRCVGAANLTPQPKASLACIVLQFFLERRPSRSAEDDENAVLDASRFIKCLHKVRSKAGDVHFFCEFLEGTRSREELCFFLWVLQVIDDTKLGIPYEVPLANLAGAPSLSRLADELSGDAAGLPHICLLKATFLTRIIYRLFHMRALKRTATPGTTPTTSHKPSGNTRVLVPTSPSKKYQVTNGSTSPASSPRKKRKSHVGEDDLRPAAKLSAHCSSSQPSQQQSLLSHASECFHSAVLMNNGAPLTLEAFNALVTQFAVAPATEELRIRLGPFFHPSGDEKKLAVEVFLVLTMEMFAHQLAWRKKTMRDLFITLAQRLEGEQVARQLQAKELAEALALKGKRPPPSAKSKPKSPAKATISTKKKPKKKKRDHDRNPNSSKYLVGLTRALLHQFLVQSGIVSDILTVDVDQLFVGILEMAGRSAKEIHFDELYETLARLDWLGNRDLQVDPTTTVLNQQWQSTEDDRKTGMLTRLRDLWLVQSKQSLALCENDPNVFVRKRAKLLTDSISQNLAISSGSVQTPPPLNQHFSCTLQGIREFLGFAWRVAAKRSDESQLIQTRERLADGRRAPHWFLSEFFLINQAIHVVGGEFPGYEHPRTLLLKAGKTKFIDSGGGDAGTITTVNDLRCFWDTSRMAIEDLLIKHGADKQVLNEPQQQHLSNGLVLELELVLKRFCVYLAHLFASYSCAGFNFVGLTLHDWLRMARELRCVDKKLPDLAAASELFFKVCSSRETESQSTRANDNDCQPHDVWISRAQFTELLIRVAFLKAEACEEKKQPALKPRGLPRPAQVVSDFCHQAVVSTAFQQRERLQEVDFVHKLSCPLVSRVLLEHRAFLRAVFFYYAKQDEEDEGQRELNQQQPGNQRPPQMDTRLALSGSDLHSFQLGKTERNSMNFDEFQSFLAAFELLESVIVTRHVGLESARLVFYSVMALENADTSQMEFEEFAAAVAALAVYRDPCPFRLWHVKIDAFVTEMQRIAAHKALRFD